MSVFMLHFESRPNSTTQDQPLLTAEGCAIADSLEEAEAMLREKIADQDYSSGTLIAYIELSEGQIANLGEREATLYLKAVNHRSQSAVQFSTVS